MKFLRNLLATLVGLFIFTFLCFVILIGIASALSTTEKVVIAEGSVLHLKIDRPIVERKSDDPLEALSEVLGDGQGSIGLKELKEAIASAKTDEKVEGILLEPQFVTSGYAKLEEIREALLDFKGSRKFVIAYSENYSEADYFLASVADEVYLNPMGMLEFDGLSSQVVFVKGTLDKLGIEPQIFKVGDFKSAVEPFDRKDMSEASRLQTSAFLNAIYDHYLDRIADARGMEVTQLKEISNELLVTKASDALQHKLVTALRYRDEVETDLRERLGIEEDKKIDFVSHTKYLKTLSPVASSSRNRIAVIYADGNIVTGEGSETSIGSDKYAKEIKKARMDDKVKAIVIRINSPGGSALASDVIWREVKLAQREKPVIASMSDVAASGGYYIAMACDTIVALPTTITGSIGVFGLLPNIAPFLEDKLGVTTDVVNTGKYSDMYTVTRSLTDFEKKVFQESVDEIYETFTQKAAEGRGMSLEDLKAVASGRVWSGVEAKANGLVDIFGTLDDAVTIAAQAAGVEEGDYKVNYYPRKKDMLQQLLSGLEDNVRIMLLKQEMGAAYPYIQQLKGIKEMTGIQARLPFDFVIE